MPLITVWPLPYHYCLMMSKILTQHTAKTNKLKTCKKNLHQYPLHLSRCPDCNRIWKEKNYEHVRELQQTWVQNNPEKIKKINQRYRENGLHKEKRLECIKKWKKANLERVKEKNKEWNKKNAERRKKTLQKWKEKNKEHVRETHRHWAQKNIKRVREKSAINAAKRRMIHIQATPSWANSEAIKVIYKECAKITSETGIKHHVDHIFPLRSRYMCGLHVETNLQILTAEENIKKNNRSWPGQLDCQQG